MIRRSVQCGSSAWNKRKLGRCAGRGGRRQNGRGLLRPGQPLEIEEKSKWTIAAARTAAAGRSGDAHAGAAPLDRLPPAAAGSGRRRAIASAVAANGHERERGRSGVDRRKKHQECNGYRPGCARAPHVGQVRRRPASGAACSLCEKTRAHRLQPRRAGVTTLYTTGRSASP